MCASPEIRINGEDAKAWVCMNGSSTYLIEPGKTAELVVGAYDFARLPRKTERVAVGYEFKHPSGRSDHYFAEPVVLPAEFRDQIREHLTQRGE